MYSGQLSGLSNGLVSGLAATVLLFQPGLNLFTDQSINLVGQTVDVYGSAIASAELFGAGNAVQPTVVSSAAIQSAEVFGAGTQSVTAIAQGSAMASTELFGAGTQTLSASFQGVAIPSAEVFGAGRVTVSVSSMTLPGAAIPSAEAFGAVNVQQVTVVQGAGIPSSEVFGAGTPVNVMTVQGAAIPSAEVFGVGTQAVTTTSQGVAIPSAEVFGAGTPNITLLNVQGSAIPSAEVFGTPSLQVGTIVQVYGSAMASTELFGAGTQAVSATAQGAAISSAEVFGAGTQVVAAPSQGAAISSAEVFGAGTQVVSAIAQGSAIPSDEVFGAVTQSATLPVQGAGIPSSEAFGAGSTLQPSSIQGSGYPGDEVFGAGTIYIFQTETVSLLGRFGGSYTYSQKVNIDTLISGLKADGNWPTIDTLHIVAGSTTQADALLNWKSSSYNKTINGSLTYTTGRNLSGFTTSNYLSDGFVPSSAGGNFAQNSATIAIYSTGDGQSGGYASGAINSGSTIYTRLIARNSSNQMASEMNGTGQLISSANTVYTAVGLNTSTRTGSSATALYKNSTQLLTGTQSSTGNQSVQIITGALNNNGTIQSADSNLSLVAEVKASGWTGTQVSNFYSRLNTYLQTLKVSTYTLTYSSDGDTNGLFYLLGTNMGMQPWANPAQNNNTDTGYSNNNAVLLSASAISTGNLNTITDRTTSSMQTTNAAGSWIRADLGSFMALSCNRYSIRHSTSSTNYLRNWKLQGTNDTTFATWTDLDVRSADTTINAASAWGTFTPNQGVSTAFRWYRILSTGTDSGGSSQAITLGEWGLYGTLTISSPTTFTYSANADTGGILYYLASTQSALNWCNGWVNPHASGIATVSASSVASGNVSNVVSRLNSSFYTNNTAGSWVQLDFGASRTVRVDAYQIRNYGFNANILRNWNLQGSNDGTTWTNLDVRTSDSTLTAAYQYWNWTCNQSNTSFWRYIRILSTGLDSSGANYVGIASMELYGAIA
jgi:hypothetical protein